MQINMSEVPFVKIAAIVLTLWFGYLLVRENVIWNIQRSNLVDQANARIQTCAKQLAEARRSIEALTRELESKKGVRK